MRANWVDRLLLLSVLICTAVAVYLARLLFSATFEGSGTTAEWFAGAGTIFAAAVALYIATRDRHERRGERDAADRAQAELVQVVVDGPPRTREFRIEVRNYGDKAILDVEFDTAKYSFDPASVPSQTSSQKYPVLDHDRSGFCYFWVDFVNAEGASVLTGVWDDVYQEWTGREYRNPSR
ncbi:hypothetical protein [Mycolicibacterium mengxianglii]|uniref:hypothetical protein n=1 Tax=Mycolicibacterium mengxianglii TaxID=2736649 RepID=UPI0018D12E40|nr:hypothetical protein [Mycolicibacterium mengxianglii]